MPYDQTMRSDVYKAVKANTPKKKKKKKKPAYSTGGTVSGSVGGGS